MKSQSFSICATVKAPAAEVEWFVNYHLAAGASRIYLFFDDPQDPAAARFKDPRVFVTCCDSPHWDRLGLLERDKVGQRRAANAKWALDQSRSEGIEWMVVIDYDELLHARRPLAEVFASADESVDVLRFEVWEGVVVKMEYDNPFTDVTHFKPYPLPLGVAKAGSSGVYLQWIWFLLRLALARMLGVKRADRRRFIVGHRSGKSAIRTRCDVSHIGSHVPLPAPGGMLTSRRAAGAAVLHFDGCGYERWKWKWGARSSGTLQWVGREHRWKYMEDYAKAAARGEECLKRFYLESKGVSPRDIRILGTLGLLETLHLDGHSTSTPAF